MTAHRTHCAGQAKPLLAVIAKAVGKGERADMIANER